MSSSAALGSWSYWEREHKKDEAQLEHLGNLYIGSLICGDVPEESGLY